MNNWHIEQGDALELMKRLPDESIDAVITDPPYLKEHLHLYSEMAEEASRILKDGHLLLSYVGSYHLNTVMQSLSEYLEYYWAFVILHKNGPSAIMYDRRLNVMYKPILAFSKGKVSYNAYPKVIKDVIKGSGREKSLHEWQQGSDELGPLIRKFTSKDSTILDPFMGSGTTGVAALQLERNFIGYELDEKYFSIAKKRIESASMQTKLTLEAML